MRARSPRSAQTMVLITALLAPGAAAAQGVLVDSRVWLPRPVPRPDLRHHPHGSYKVDSIEVDATVRDQVARVQVTQTFKNTGSRQMEAQFIFPIPYDGAIDSLTLLVDGKEHEGRILPADEARRVYESIVRRNKDPALLEWLGTGMFKTSVFPLPPGAERTVTLQYSQVCRQSRGVTDFLFPLSIAKYTSGALDKLRVRVVVEADAPLASVYCPTYDARIERPDEKRAIVTYKAEDCVPTADFRLFFDVSQEEGVGASVVSYRPDKDEPGYFLLLASPTIEADKSKPIPKTVLFALDRSGSMSGKKLEQAKEALKFVLNNLREGDTFNIVAYDSQIETFRPEVQRYNDETRRAAIGFVEALYAGGSTNINGALERCLGMLKDSSRPAYVIFLSDGLPTTGETGEAAIVAASESANDVRARVFPFGVGYDVNSRLLDRIARANYGQTDYVRPDEDIEVAVSKLYGRIGAPVMTDVALEFDVEDARLEDGPVVNRVYPSGVLDLFAGDQAVIVGRYRKPGDAKVTLRGEVRGDKQQHSFPAELVEESEDDTNAFVARLWAMRRVGEIIDEIDLKGKNEELVNELVALATKHGIVTQYTSFLADETANHNELAGNRARAGGELSSLERYRGRGGFDQRRAKLGLQTADAPARAFGGRGGGAATTAPAAEEALQGQLRNNAFWYDAGQDRSRVAQNIRQVGRKTFFQRGQRWVDSSVNEQEEQNAQKVQRYSDEYFALVARHGRHVAQYLAIEDPVVVKLGGTVYEW